MEDQDFIPTVLELYDVLMTFYTDTKILTKNNKELISSEEIQSFNRLHIKSLVSSIEGSIYVIKQIVLQKNNLNSENGLNGYELMFIAEKNPRLKENGDIDYERISSIGLIPNLNFTIKIIKKVFNADLKIEKETLKKIDAVRLIRNRITHPKTFQSLKISHTEMKDVASVFFWYRDFMNQILNILDTV
jgi:hypothetical protein